MNIKTKRKTAGKTRAAGAAKPKFDREALDRLASVFAAFADGTRLALLQELMAGPRTVNELFAAIGTTQANISRQLKILHQAGLLRREQKGLFVTYSVGDRIVKEMCNIACRKLSQAPVRPVPRSF